MSFLIVSKRAFSVRNGPVRSPCLGIPVVAMFARSCLSVEGEVAQPLVYLGLITDVLPQDRVDRFDGPVDRISTDES